LDKAPKKKVSMVAAFRRATLAVTHRISIENKYLSTVTKKFAAYMEVMSKEQGRLLEDQETSVDGELQHQ
jgi:hypothetical protein